MKLRSNPSRARGLCIERLWARGRHPETFRKTRLRLSRLPAARSAHTTTCASRICATLTAEIAPADLMRRAVLTGPGAAAGPGGAAVGGRPPQLRDAALPRRPPRPRAGPAATGPSTAQHDAGVLQRMQCDRRERHDHRPGIDWGDTVASSSPGGMRRHWPRQRVGGKNMPLRVARSPEAVLPMRASI